MIATALYCDAPGCERGLRTSVVTNTHALRSAAETLGWTTTLDNDAKSIHDWCPKHERGQQ